MNYLFNFFMILCLINPLSGCMEYQPHNPEPDPIAAFNPRPLEYDMVEDEFLNEHGKPLNIAMYMDRSCSMVDNQWLLWNNIDEITAMLDERNIYYHIGITGTGSSYEPISGVFREWNGVNYVTPHTINPTATLRQLLNRSGNDLEAGVEAIAFSFSTSENYEASGSFWRRDTPIHVITMSDEVDQSTHYGYGAAARALELYEQDMNAHVTYTGVVDPAEANGYNYLANRMGEDGRTVSIFDPNWVNILTDELDALAASLKYEYYLRDLPQEDTLEVIIYDDGIHFVFSHEDWTYNAIRNSITFNEFTPESDAIIYVRYIPNN